ncbi:MAG: hypothetical protein IJH37_08970 [Clostridia bacterium]|nr:hypothetical protein [Clostridia bacterium]
MENFKLVLIGTMCALMLMGCSTAANNHAATTQTDKPRSTAAAEKPTAGNDTIADDIKNGADKARDTAGNVVDDAGNIVEDTGDAIDHAADSVGDAVKN